MSMLSSCAHMFFNTPPTTQYFTLSLHDALPISLPVQPAVVIVRKPMRLVADALQQSKRVARTWQTQRVRAAGKVDFLLPLGQCDQGNVVRACLRGRCLRHGELALAAIDHGELGEWPPF